ncbi:unnamed protein product [Spirodela intermedia]|uniref:Uncharacterized protein n=1 Tax=Spirodela intermedia TaxID=51605 RepID=A0A7I8J168_SPIIN|nr:unnamed protein product [Spirodela intermedia]CAA6663974.1 unnamed protein product [Spirodela intermedia]
MTCGTPTFGESSVRISQTPRTEAGAGETLEESAEGYLQELIQRCMVIVVRDAKDVGFFVCDGIRDD